MAQATLTRAREKFLPYALPSIGEEEIAEVADSMRSGWITTGPKTKKFEGDLQTYIGAKHAIAVNSCTAGLHVALTALGVGPGDEVILPTLTFCATANVVAHLGARPVLVDVGEDFNVTPGALESAITTRTKVIMPVHYGGQACELDAIYDIAMRHKLPIVEDAAHAIGSEYKAHRIGSDTLSKNGVTRAVVFSFYATKNMTTGEGGVIATDNDALAERMRLLTLHGMSRDAWKRYTSAGSWYYEIVAAGYKDNMTDMQAAMGIHQLKRLDGFIEKRQEYARIYDDAFQNMPAIAVPVRRPDRKHIYHLYAIKLNLDRLSIDRGAFIEELKTRKIGTSVHFIPVHLHPFYREHFGYSKGQFPTAEAIYERIISLPLYPAMSPNDIQDVIAAVQEICVSNQEKS